MALAQAELPTPAPNGAVMAAAAVGPSVQVAGVSTTGTSATDGTRAIQSNVKVLDANYTIVAGDTLVKIAQRFNTTVERIQAFNPSLADPRALRIGTRLIIPPPF